MDSIDRSQNDTSERTSDKYVAKMDDISPVASGSYVKVNGDNHIPDQLFQNDEDTCSSTNSSSTHNLVIDQPEEANNNAEYECIDAGKKTNQKDSSTNSLKRKLSTYENGSPEYKQPHLTSCKPVTKLSPKYNSKQSQKMSMEYRSDNNESKRNAQLGEASEKRRKCGATVDISISRRVDNEDHFQEYAKYLRLKPTEKYKCFKCYNNTFETLAQLRGHQKVCLFKENHRHSSQDGNSLDAYISSNSNPPFENASTIPTSEQIQARLEKQYIDTKTTAKAKKKVFLCAACGTYYENWNLFLHMREVHGRHICLYCVGMFPTAERLTLHLEMKHDLEQNHFESHEKLLQASRDTCYLMCCICEHIFTEHEDFQDHKCNKLVTPCALCGQKGRHSPNCKSSQSERSTKEKSKRKNKSSKAVGISDKSSGFAGIISQSVNDNSRLTTDNIICDTRKTKSDNLNQWNFKMNGCVTETNVELSSDTFGIMESILSGKHSPEKMETQIQPLNLSTLGYLDNIMENSNSIQQSTTSSFKDDMLFENSNQQYIQSIENEQNNDASASNSFSDAIEQSVRDLSSEVVEAKHYQGLTENSNENAIISTLNQDITVSENIASEDSLNDVQSNNFKNPINTKIETLSNSTEVSQNEEKPLFVPKFKIKIPKEYQAPIDSEHSSTESDEEELEQSATGAEMTDDEIQDTLKESSTETNSFESKIEQQQEQQEESITEKDISKQEIDIEDNISVELTALNELNKMDIESPTDIAVQEETPADGIELANDDVLTIDLLLDRPIDRIPMVEFLRICLKSTYPICLYCNHARRISVNGHSLALHMIAQHKFAATVDSITAEELQPKTIVIKLKASLPDLIDIFFNMETYCNIEKEGLQPYEKIFECFLCRFETRIHKELYLHNRKMHLKTAILCFMCRANFFSYSEILCHMCPGMPNKCVIFDIKFRCCLCDIDQIPSAFRLMVHLRKKHFACDVCLEDCQDQSRLSSHVWKHKLHHLCYRCGIAYRNKPDITKHLFWKHGTESVLCKRCLQKRWPHVYHFCIPPPSFVCEVCNIAFSKAMFLKVHKRLHTGDAPYPCTEDNCDKKFISRKLLLKHVAQHTEEIEIKSIVEVKKENETKVDEKVEEVQQENVKEETTKKDTETNKKKRKKTRKEPPENIGIDEIMNLPAPNLSESDSSEDSDVDKIKTEIQSPHVPTVMLSPPSDNGEDEKDVKPIIDIWENFKSFQASRNKNNNEDDIQDTDIIPITPILHVSQSDHDYCMMYKAIAKEVKTEKILDIITETKTELENSKVTDKTVILPKKKQKSPRKAPKSGSDSTSSGSSSGSDSSCSCGSNCSCSSSSGSSSNSSSSTENSNSSTSEGRRRIAVKRAAKVEKRNRNKSENSSKANTSDVVDVVTTDSKPHDTINFNSIILETDLETDESDTDEDFYDEHPQKLATQLLAEKRKQLMMQTCLSPSHNYDIVENSRPSTPSLPEEMMKEKKVKLKKKKREKKGSKSGTIPIFKLNIPNILGATPVSEDFEVELMKEVLAASPPYVSPPPSSIPPPPIFETTQNLASPVEQPQIQEIPPQNRTSTPIPAPIAPRNRLSTGSSSDADAPLKRSKRARRPNKFYGYSSDDDLIMPHIIGPAAFKPTPPPNLTWRKEDLPTPSKSVTAKSSKSPGNALKKTTPSSTPPLPPIPPIIIRPSAILQSRATSVIDPIIQKPPIVEPMRVPPVPVHHIQPPQYYPSSRESMESESSDEDKLHIPVPTQYNTQMQKQMNPIIAPIKTIISTPPAPIPTPTTQRIPPALLPNPDLARLQYFQRNNIRWPIRPPAGARPPREGESVYCYCRCPYDEVSEMIACDGDDCMIEWFHFECVGIMVPPKGKWFCPECRPKYPHEMSDSYENT